MPTDAQRIHHLLARYIAQDATADEATELFAWIAEAEDHDQLHAQVREFWDQYQPAEGEEGGVAADFERIFANIRQAMPAPERRPVPQIRRRWPRIAAAAAILIVLAGAAWWFTTCRQPAATQQPLLAKTTDIPPGGNRATLTLSGGQKIILDSAHTGQLARQGSTNIIKADSGSLTYQLSHSPLTNSPQYNTLTTPRGGQYQLTLPDGTRVWLDAASSITYPTAFTGRERKVSMTGQAYFEVVRKEAQPFEVTTNGGLTIRDIGTAFNVNAYADEPMTKITLADGAVAISQHDHQLTLSPGQQAQAAADAPLKLIRNADLEQALAWKNGMVRLGGAGIQEIMRQLARWYDVDVKYEGNLDRAVFTGIVSRRQNVSGLIRVLEATGSVHFNIDGKKIIVKP